MVKSDLAEINRVRMMEELAASGDGEVVIRRRRTDAKSLVRWLRRDTPDVAEGCEAASGISMMQRALPRLSIGLRSLYRRDTSDWNCLM